MKTVVDANILLRRAKATSSHHPVVLAAMTELKRRGHDFMLLPQAIYESWVVATRPKAQNGLGLIVAECVDETAVFRTYTTFLPDDPLLTDVWLQLIADHQCRGKIAHDARYVAAMRTHGLSHLLTFNVADFACFLGIVVLDPHAFATVS